MDFVSSITLAFKDAFSSGFNDAQTSLAGMRGALDEIGGNQSMTRLAADMAMMTSMTDPMRKALSAAMDQPSRIAGTLDTSFRAIQVAAGATNEEMGQMRQELLAIGGRAIAGPEAVASAFAEVAGGIDDASKRMAVMSAAVSLAEANQADLAMSTNAMVNVMNAWNLSADQAAIAADILTQTSLMGVGHLDDFAGSISHISALAAGAGIGLDELGASFAYVTTKGLDAGQAQKQFKGIISTLVSSGENLSKLYASLGIESGQAMLQQYGLAESLVILKDALGGDEQAFGSLIGSAEAATIALAMTEDAYVSFAGSFAEGMGTVTEAARGVQLESIEAKMARLDSASRSLQAQIGQDINGIKGFFVDMKFGFLSNVVSPIMSSPVGGAVSKIAAVTGMAAKTMLDMGSGALNAAAQMTTLAANISNAGGIAKMFTSGLGLMKSGFSILMSPIKAVGTSIIGFIANLFGIGGASGAAAAGTGTFGAASAGAAGGIGVATGATTGFAASLWAATWPILAVIAAIALVAGGVYLLIKNWDKVSGFFKGLWDKIVGFFSAAWNWIKNLIFGTSDWILGAVAIFFPFIGIPALIIKHWGKIKEFFSGLWEGVKGVAGKAWEGIKSGATKTAGFLKNNWKTIAVGMVNPWAGGLKALYDHNEKFRNFIDNTWGKIRDIAGAVWNKMPDGVKNVFTEINGIISGVINGIKNFFSGLWEALKQGPAATIEYLKNAFFGLVDKIKGVFAGIDNFFSGVWDGVKNIAGKAWDGISGIASSAWDGMKGFASQYVENVKQNWTTAKDIAGKAWEGISGIASSAWDGMKGFASQYVENAKQNWAMAKDIAGKAWDGISGIASSAWDGMKGFAGQYVENAKQNWAMAKDIAGKAWDGISGIASGAWDGIKGVWEGGLNFFSGLWEKIKSIFQGFIDWIGGKVEVFTAPFKAIGDVVGGVFDKVGGFFKGIVGGGKESGAALNNAFASGIQSNAAAPGAAFGTSLQTVSRQMPHSDAQEGPLSTLTASGRALTETFASGMDESDLREKADLVFSAAMPQGEALEFPAGERTANGNGSQTIHIQNLYLQADECENLFDFVRMIMHSVNNPQEVPV